MSTDDFIKLLSEHLGADAENIELTFKDGDLNIKVKHIDEDAFDEEDIDLDIDEDDK